LDCGTDRTGESPLTGRAGAGRRGVTPGGAGKRQPSEEKEIRRHLVEKALKALQTEVSEQTVFTD